MPQFDTIIKNGTIVDGTRVPRYKADVGIKNGKIAKIGRLNANDATKIVDATGLIVAPGFIDLHTLMMPNYTGIRIAPSAVGME
jgi:N-acyl-D-amino-acid deacylase